VYYDADEDPLKAEVDRLIALGRARRFRRVLDVKTSVFKKPESEEDDHDILRGFVFPHELGHPQDGNFMVVANFVNRDDQVTGGGWVASFEKKYDAERCVHILRCINPVYEARIEASSNEGD
jgi:hypothetical protein